MTREARKPTKGVKKKKIVEEERSQQKENAERTATLAQEGQYMYNGDRNKILNSVAKTIIHLNLVVLRRCLFNPIRPENIGEKNT